MFLHLSVSHSIHRGGVCPMTCWDTLSLGRHPLAHTPFQAATPLGRHPAADTPGRHPQGRHSP